MTRTVLAVTAASFLAVSTAIVPAVQAGGHHHHHRHHSHHHHHGHHHHFRHHHVHRVYIPVCVKYDWVWNYGHKKWVCVKTH